ncbi:hypothetical protein RND81_07G069800 [Saponaria officinalis]|uniref:Trichome birefringence-like C-terminal domain-containing protein n=1 Tax=Saponaria officinalis TaxID=3572 RepID=A0AAW1JNC0_SAPOF
MVHSTMTSHALTVKLFTCSYGQLHCALVYGLVVIDDGSISYILSERTNAALRRFIVVYVRDWSEAVVIRSGPRVSFSVQLLHRESGQEYNASLMLMRDSHLVKLTNHRKLGRILNLNTVSHGESWKGIDVLIFNTWHWWLHTGRKQLWDYIKDGDRLYEDMDRLVAYEKGLRTWARWMDKHLSSTKTKVYFQGVSPDHMNALNWRAPKARICVGAAQPETNIVTHTHKGETILEKVLKGMKKPINLLRINKMSQFRRDGHPSIYGIGRHKLPDCTHWCLPGVPDTWNHLFYTSLFNYSHSV